MEQITCAICETQFTGLLHASHLKTHGINSAQYQERYGPVCTKEYREKARLNGRLGGGGNNAAIEYNIARGRKKQEEYAISPKTCKHCSTALSYEDFKAKKSFCDSSCSASYHNSIRARRRKVYDAATCNHCGKVIGRKGKYCDSLCQANHKRSAFIRQWLSGIESGGYLVLNRMIRNYLIEQAGHKCTECGWNKVHPKTGKCPLHIDHINGDCVDHRPENLRVICPNCHSLTENYGSLNKNNKGRTVRRRERLKLDKTDESDTET
jgi:hypothetical protein